MFSDFWKLYKLHAARPVKNVAATLGRKGFLPDDGKRFNLCWLVCGVVILYVLVPFKVINQSEAFLRGSPPLESLEPPWPPVAEMPPACTRGVWHRPGVQDLPHSLPQCHSTISEENIDVCLAKPSWSKLQGLLNESRAPIELMPNSHAHHGKFGLVMRGTTTGARRQQVVVKFFCYCAWCKGKHHVMIGGFEMVTECAMSRKLVSKAPELVAGCIWDMDLHRNIPFVTYEAVPANYVSVLKATSNRSLAEKRHMLEGLLHASLRFLIAAPNSCSMIHGDFDPTSNILVDPTTGALKVIDFGNTKECCLLSKEGVAGDDNETRTVCEAKHYLSDIRSGVISLTLRLDLVDGDDLRKGCTEDYDEEVAHPFDADRFVERAFSPTCRAHISEVTWHILRWVADVESIIWAHLSRMKTVEVLTLAGPLSMARSIPFD
eukprot:TRINITY_DN46063_c0_g1_i1.p1 TRINITY_DN46063_c0_g1~~TRINITY_DN46063_c0_g1_i1.p1  ORF type:complete len:434 (+),score=39.99 TRINITY_DN46063_c0_g1_i1:71-1372(+)